LANIRVEVAAATAAVGYDMISTDFNARVPEGRRLKGLMLTGSTAAGDCIIEVMVGNKSIGKFSNTSTGLVGDRTKDYREIGEYVPANQLVQAFVRDAANTNPVVLEMEFQHSTTRTGYPRRSGGYRSTTRRPGRMSAARRPSSGMY